jgi:hypothetical protein
MKTNSPIDHVPLKLIFQTAWKKKWPSLIFATVLFLIICIKAFFLSNPFSATRIIDIGYLTQETEKGLQEQYIVNVNQEEAYLNNELLVENNLDSDCYAKALNLRNPQLKIVCSDKNSEKANEKIDRLTKVILSNHNASYQRLVDYQHKIIEHKSEELSRTAQVLKQINDNLKSYATNENEMFINLFIELFKAKEEIIQMIENQKALIQMSKPSSVENTNRIASIHHKISTLLPIILIISLVIAVFTAFALAVSEISLNKKAANADKLQ